MDEDDAVLPEGVKLRDPNDYAALREDIYEGAKNELAASFPATYGGVRMEIGDINYADEGSYSYADQRQKILEDGSLYRRLRGTVNLFDDATGDLLDSKKMTIMKVPVMNEGTFLDNGSRYTTSNQSRLLPGAYSRRKNNGGLETQFNVRVGTGPGFRVSFEPDSSLYYLESRGSRLRLYSVLKDIGVSDEEMEKMWGSSILKANRDKYDSRAMDKALAKLVRKPDPTWSKDQKAEAIRTALDTMRIHKRVAQRNLPGIYDRVKMASWSDQDDGGDVYINAMREVAIKMASGSYGAGVLFWLGKGYYLLEETTSGENKGKLRPAGGGKSLRDKTLRETIIREIGEEFGLERRLVAPYIRKQGSIKDGDFKDCALFVMWNHGLKPGIYQASNSKYETVKLVKARLDDPRYIGPNLKTDLYNTEDGDDPKS